MLYIKEHSFKDKIDETIQDGSKGNKFHVSDCATIKSYRESGKKRFDRYVITTNLSGEFPVAGTNQLTGQYKEGNAKLCICKNCLSHLNYKGYSENRNSVFSGFNLEEFFSTYSSFFSYLPNRTSSSLVKETYSDDWGGIARNYKAGKQFKCEHCLVNLSEQRKLLHVHHKNGVKSDNLNSNLIALCADCHRKEPFHEHLFIPQKDTVLINKLRRVQSILITDKWSDVFAYADPSMLGFLKMCQKTGVPIPSVAHELLDNHNNVITRLELAWPSSKQCVVINKDDAAVAKDHGWNVWSMIEAIEKNYDFRNYI
jgi:hypothetical protein